MALQAHAIAVGSAAFHAAHVRARRGAHSDVARAVMATMREPTEAMVVVPDYDWGVVMTWQAMIDEAMK